MFKKYQGGKYAKLFRWSRVTVPFTNQAGGCWALCNFTGRSQKMFQDCSTFWWCKINCRQQGVCHLHGLFKWRKGQRNIDRHWGTIRFHCHGGAGAVRSGHIYTCGHMRWNWFRRKRRGYCNCNRCCPNGRDKPGICTDRVSGGGRLRCNKRSCTGGQRLRGYMSYRCCAM